ncbi:Cytochrome P450 monooxygenase radP [Lachnellula suecica]|uniref:Cytochrome P450 monooxygenase radP n=1 Tax=Lachnellula suecica TaxID=602035 RepID=A0A8T9CFM4_9HELO|nr:Cytochrome P450 monooxygenase radP [Lachnellula suecica]
MPLRTADIYGFKQDRSELKKDPAFYKRGDAAQILSIGLFLQLKSKAANQEEHIRIRKLLAPAFSDGALLEQESLLTHHFDLLVSQLKRQIDRPEQGRVDMMAYYNFVTFDIIGDLVLGESFGALEGGEYHPWIRFNGVDHSRRNVSESIKLLGLLRLAQNYPAIGVVFAILQKLMPSFAEKRKLHMKFTKDKVRKRLELKTDRNDLIAYVLPDKDEKSGLSFGEILGNSRVLLTAGSETTATNLCGVTWYLLTQTDILHRVRDEVRTAFKSADEITLRSVSTPGRLPYLDALVQETFRCYSSLPATLPRITSQGGAIIDGDYVPGNVSVGVHQWSTYHSTNNFALPNDFIPERWLSNAPQKFQNDNKEALQPFHLGPRVCLGKKYNFIFKLDPPNKL